MEAGLEKLSVLIPLAGNEQVQLLIREQLKQWNDSKLDSTIDHSVFSVYQTLAGLNVSSYAEKDQFQMPREPDYPHDHVDTDNELFKVK